jgi:hypothetical protein
MKTSMVRYAREGAIAAGENVSPAHGRFKFDDALKDYLT